jgi:hypothetical protein
MRKIILIAMALCLMIGVGSISGCASNAGNESAAAAESPYSDVPAGSKLAKVQLNSNDAEVRKIMGDPDDSNAYMTGKAWIPFYFGPDTHRADWMYTGQGRVVFSRNRWTGGLKVIAVMYNPNELK